MGTNSIYQVILNTFISFWVLFIITRLLGKKQMSQLTFFNYVTGITIGSIAANMVDLVLFPILFNSDIKEFNQIHLYELITFGYNKVVNFFYIK